MYKCRKCEIDIVASERQIKKKDFICADCYREYARAYRLKRKLDGNPVVGGKMPREYHAAYEKMYVQKPEVKERLRSRARDRRNNPNERHKHKARWKVARALASGRLTKGYCEVCKAEKVDAHHDDYSQPLSVRWLCRQHHADLHAKATGGAA